MKGQKMFEWKEYVSEVERVTYDPDDNKLRIYTDRVPREMYDAFREAGFNRAPKQGCFFAVWVPAREDIVLALCETIEDEDSTLMERAEEKNARFAGYTANAGRRAHEASDKSRKAVAGIPFGQPILIGHHSERRHRNAIKKAQNQATKAVEEFDRRDYWASRARGVLGHASRTFDPGVIARRIKKLQAVKRGYERKKIYSESDVAWITHKWIQDREYEWGTVLSELSREQQVSCQKHVDQMCQIHIKWSDRWIDHLAGQILYWETIYSEVSGHCVHDQEFQPNKGDWVQNKRGAWARVTRVNKDRTLGLISSVSIDLSTVTTGTWEPRKWDYGKIVAVKTPEEYHAVST